MSLTEEEEYELLTLEKEKAMSSSQSQDKKIENNQETIPQMLMRNLEQSSKSTGQTVLKASNEAAFGIPGFLYNKATGNSFPEDAMSEYQKAQATGMAFIAPGVPLAEGAKWLAKLIKPVLKYDNTLVQAKKSKSALDNIRGELGKAVELATKEIENVPTNLDLTNIPEKVFANIKKSVYGIDITKPVIKTSGRILDQSGNLINKEEIIDKGGDIVNNVGNLRKLKEATYDMLTSKDFVEASNVERAEILRFAGKISGSMRDAARTVGKNLDKPLDSYSNFMDRYSIINSKLVNKFGDAEANKLKSIFKITSEANTKKAFKELSLGVKELGLGGSPELRAIRDSMRRRELVKNLATAALTGTAVGLTTKAAFGDEVNTGHEQIKTDEGFRGNIYRDTVGIPTVGYGFNINDPAMRRLIPKDVLSSKRELSKKEADVIFNKRYEIAENDAIKYLGKDKFLDLNKKQREAITNMSYAMGINRLNGFKRLKKALIDKDYEKASTEVLNSKWAVQVKGRAKRIASSILG